MPGFAKPIAIVLLAALLPVSCEKQGPPAEAPAVSSTAVTVTPEGMTRGGLPYFVKGAGGDTNLKELAARGANSIRTWSTEGLGEILDEAHAHGLTVSAGIWLEYETSWFSYHKPADIEKQTARVREDILKYRDHPALLAWGLGNEIEGTTKTDPALWQQLDRLAVMVRELDPHHPTFTAIAGFAPFKLEAFDQHAPNLDFLGINTYGGAAIVRRELEKHGLKRPWMLTEWGARGPWESPKTSFKANIEPTSSEKADFLRRTYREVLRPEGGLLGGYAFVWAWKHEATSSWFGLLTYEGDTTGMVDALEESWTGRAPADRAPDISAIAGVPPEPVAGGHQFQATVTASDPEGDPLAFRWIVLPELFGKEHHTHSEFPAAVPGTIGDAITPAVTVTAPAKPGTYRLYVWVSDPKRHTAIANMPFQVR